MWGSTFCLVQQLAIVCKVFDIAVTAQYGIESGPTQKMWTQCRPHGTAQQAGLRLALPNPYIRESNFISFLVLHSMSIGDDDWSCDHFYYDNKSLKVDSELVWTEQDCRASTSS